MSIVLFCQPNMKTLFKDEMPAYFSCLLTWLIYIMDDILLWLLKVCFSKDHFDSYCRLHKSRRLKSVNILSLLEYMTCKHMHFWGTWWCGGQGCRLTATGSRFKSQLRIFLCACSPCACMDNRGSSQSPKTCMLIGYSKLTV